jgi:hypothetical protein
MIRRLITAAAGVAVVLLGATATLPLAAPAGASAVHPSIDPSACTNDNGEFSSVTVGGVNYFLGAPNNIFPGAAALLKPNGNSTTLFIHCNSLTVSQELVLSNRGLALTSRDSSPGGLVTFEPAGNSGNGFASQKWIYAGTNPFTFKNVKTGLFLRVRNSGPIMYQTVTTGSTATSWNQS